jgi:hypothetical protein
MICRTAQEDDLSVSMHHVCMITEWKYTCRGAGQVPEHDDRVRARGRRRAVPRLGHGGRQGVRAAHLLLRRGALVRDPRVA